MAITRYGTSVTLCEDTRQTFELYDLLKQADPNYSAVEPARITLYVFNGSTWVTVSAPGFFSAVDKDTFEVDMSYLPNFNGIQQVRVLGSDSSGNSFILNLTINVTPVNDAPTGEDETVALANGDSYVLGLADFGFNDPVEGDAFKSVVFTTVPAHGTLLLDGVAVTAGQEILASDIEAGKLSYTAPVDAGGPIGFDFQVRDTGGTDGCGGNDLDLTPNTITFNVPYPATAIIGDRVWEDTNGNGVQDTGETGLAGVTVVLKDIAGNTVATTTTDGSGNYSFTVNAGTYSVAVVPPAGYKVTEADMGPSDATDSDIDDAGNSPLVTVAAGDNNTTIDAGLFRTAEIGDRVWLDTNGNGQQDTGEAGVAGVIVRLYNAAGDLVDGPLATDANGNYLFTNLRPGTYSVQFDKTTLPAGYSFTTRDAGSDATDSDANSLDGKTIQTVLDSGESDRTWDAGIVANPGAITGTVLEDLDHNGTGDTPIAGVTVVLKDASGAPIATTTTDANGNYSFANVPAGNYTVEQTNKPGFTDVSDIDGGNPNSIAVTVTPGATNPGNNFIDERLPGNISGTVREDLDNNNTGDTPIAGVTVVLKDASGAPIATTTTDANGNYSFANVPAGNYTVEQTNKPGYTDVSDIDGGNPNSIAVSLQPGQSSTGNDFVDERLPGAITGTVLEDLDHNGTGDTPIAGVTVVLKDASGAPIATTTTDANGNYSFANVPAGNYTVEQTNKPGFTDVSDTDGGNPNSIAVSLQPGQSSTGNDFVDERLPGAITGTVLEDLDHNGTGDTPIAGVTVVLKDASGAPIATTTTDANGNYSFANVPAGNYTVEQTNKPGFTDVSDTDGGNPNSIAVSLQPGQSSTGNDFVDERLPGAITGTVLEDLDHNGTGDTPIAGVTVVLKDASGAPIATTTTDANGNYSFANVPAGNYTVEQTNKPGFTDVSDIDGGNPNSIAVTVTPGATNPGNTFIDERLPGAITGTVLEDLDNNNTGDTPIAGVTVVLKDAAGTPIATTTTDANGNYSFANVPAGNYTVEQTNKPGYTDVSDIDGGNPNSIAVTVTPGATNPGNNFIDERLPGNISGTVREDLDNNNTGDTPIAGVTVVLKDAAGTPIATTTTDANGNYSFANVPAGNYTVEQTNKPGYTDVSDIDGGNPNSIAVSLQPGQSSTGNDFVDERPATLGDRVWLDTNANGVQDAGEAGLAGVTVQLKNADGSVAQTATTDANGNYSFTVSAGTYSVAVQTPGGYVVTGQDLGGNEALDSDINAAGQSAQVTLTSGQNNPNVDAGLYKLAELGDRVWFDANGNGQQDMGEAGVQGVKVTLLDASGNPVGASLTTDANGNYLFTGLKPGTYSVQFDKTTLPAGYSFTTANSGSDATDSDANSLDGKTIQTVLDSGESDRTWDAGIVANPGAITGTVLEDLDHNGTGDTPIAGVTVVLKDASGAPIATTTTDANGNYSFANVPAGNYTVEQTNKPGYTDVSDTDGGNPNSIAVTVTPGATNPGNTFIDERLPGNISGTVREDLDNNNTGDTPIAGVTVVLKDAAGVPVATTTTDANGNYSFANVPAGNYTVEQTNKPGYTDVSDIDGGNPNSIAVSLQPGQSSTGNDFVDERLPGAITGTVLEDLDNNGTGDTPIAGVTVVLKDAAGTPIATTTTDANGNYSFANVPAGNYTVEQTNKPGYTDVSDTDGGNPNSIAVTVTPGATNSGNTFIDERLPGNISGTVREDLDNNNTGDTPIAGVTVVLKDAAGTPIATTTTDANGNYSFAGVPAGNYTVEQTNKPGYTDVSDIDGGNPNSIAVSLQPGQSSTGNDFVDERPATLGDRVWLDTNANGVQDAGEAGLAGVTVQLKNADGSVAQTATTDANGNYSFTVSAGTYSVAVQTPGGYVVTGQDLGGNEALDSDINAAGQSAQVTLTSGQNNPNVDAGLYKLAELGDRVWFDANGNGQQDMGEAGVQGVKVTLLDASGNPVGASLTTDANGNYLFTGLKPGTYSVQFDKTTLPAGYSFTTANSGSDATDSDANSLDGKTIQTVLDSGESDRTWDAGIVANPGAITGTVLEDLDHNGTGDTPIAGVTVVLKDAAGTPIATTTTDANGNYSFANVPAGNYTVEQTNKPGYTDVSDTDGGNPNSIAVTVTPGATNSGNTFIDERLPGNISGTVREDLDNNNTGDTPIAGVTVVLKDAAGVPVATTTTDANGNYSFANVPAGKYTVEETNKPGYTDVSDIDGGNPNSIAVSLQPGQSSTGNDFVDERLPGAITGTVLEDLDHNGTGDTPIAGVTVVLKDAAGVPVATTTTDANGNYSFAGVPAGNYTVEQTNKPGYTDVSDIDGGNPNSIAVTVTPGATNSGNTFIDERTAAIGDKVWLDKNANGVQDAGEAGLAGVTVKLLDSAGNVVTTATTDANGNYLFGNLVPGNYAVQVVAPAGYTVTGKDLGGNDALDSDIDPTTGKTITTTLSAGETDLSWDAGLYQKASIGDRVWLDANKNGVQDTGEAGIAGVTVKLLNAAGGVAATATTDANGNYLFSNLTPGSYSVQVVAPAGYSITGKDLGGNDALDSDIDPATGSTIATTLESGENDLSWDAGLYQQTASYGDKVWLDKNANGVQDAGETGLAGITVKLLNSTGGVVASTTTDANGNYLFNNLTPGDYAAQVVAPAGYFVSPKDQGGNDATDSDFDPTTGKTINTTLVANENDLSWDAGLYQKASIGDKVWADCNNNGLQDGTEAGVPGVVVKLLDASGNVVATTLTDGSGNYVFKDLMPGTYSVQVVAPAGYTFTSQDQGTNDAIDSDVGAGGVSGTNLIVNGSFESGTTGWTGYGDSIEVGTAGAYGVSAVTGAMVAELDANCVGSNTGFYQNVATVAGQTYQLSVDLAQRAGYAASTNTVEVWWEGAKIATIDPTSTALTKYSFTVTAADASSRVEFREQAGDDDSVGGIIDNVSLVSTASSTAGKTAQTVLESGENDMSWDAGLTVQKVTATFDFSGNTATDGTDGNIYCYSNNGISVNASAWSRDKTYGSWSKAFLGAYGGGLGVTDSSEGSGSGDSHTVDNSGRDNYVLFEFSQTVVVDKTYLGYVVGDSDVKVWIGNVNGAFDSHIALTDAVLSSMGFTEVNSTTLSSARWADLNANGFAGNVLVIAANTTGGDCNDNFKIEQLVVSTASAFCATDVSIGDKVWNDANMNGVQDAGEAGIAGVTVKLLNSAGSVITTTTTDANGNYLFSQLAAGDYKIQVVTPNGYVITGKDVGGNDALDSDIDSSGTTGIYTLTQGSNNLSVDAGLYCPPVTASIGDKVWEDMNYNGLQDAGEAGIKGVTVKLLNSAGTVVATATTDANGNYLFSNLAPGDYKVQVVAPTGYYITKQNQGTNDAVDSDIDAAGKTALVTLSAGENDLSVDGGLYRKASIGDKVWDDINHNNLQDSGEAGIANVKVWLWSATTQSWTSTYTDAYGNYKFTNLNPGSYQLCFDKSATVYKGIDMSNWFWGTKDVGTDNSRDSDAYSTTDQAYTAFTTLVSGEADMTWDAAITPIVLDLDRNGIQTIAREDSTGKFDLFGNGKAIDSGWISSGDAFLAIDIDHNGKIDNLSELFGGTSKGDGFAKLGAFDSNGDGFVDASDAHFADLRVWQDLNGNHQTDAGELRTLAEAGVASLKVDHIDLPAVDAQGNLHLERSSAVMADGSSIDMADVYFNVSLADANEAGVELPNLASLLGDDRSLDLVLGASVSVGEAAVSSASSVGNDSAVAALGQLSSLYEEQQYALMAA